MHNLGFAFDGAWRVLAAGLPVLFAYGNSGLTTVEIQSGAGRSLEPRPSRG
jgi:hypothetical protein